MATSVIIPIYDDSIPPIPISGSTAWGYYDNDPQFQADGPRFIVFAARKLGHPITEIELQDKNFYQCLEEAVTTYAAELYEYKIRDNYLSLEGNSTGSQLNNALITPSLGTIIRISETYGSEAGVGGTTRYYTGSIDLKYGQQNYDLDAWASQSLGLGSNEIEIKKVFYEASPAIVRYFDPYAGTGTGIMSLMQTFGFGQYSPGVNFMLMPVYFDILKIQAIEFNDQIRKSAFSFQIIDNQLKIFPIPTIERPLQFTYIIKSERNSVIQNTNGGLITNPSNVPFNTITYSTINGPGKRWIFEYAAALCKEVMGLNRGKYTTVPIPGAETTLNGDRLIADAREEKRFLIEQLRAYLDDTSRQKQLERKKMETDMTRDTLGNIPMVIYIG